MSVLFVPAQTDRRSRRTAAALVAAATLAAAPPASAELAHAYMLFEIAAASDYSATVSNLKSTSLMNCKQLFIGNRGQDVFISVDCDDSGGTQLETVLNQAVMKLSQVNGVAKTTVFLVKRVQ